MIVRREHLHPGAQRSLFPSLQYRYWGHYIDADGDPVELDSGRAIVRIIDGWPTAGDLLTAHHRINAIIGPHDQPVLPAADTRVTPRAQRQGLKLAPGSSTTCRHDPWLTQLARLPFLRDEEFDRQQYARSTTHAVTRFRS